MISSSSAPSSLRAALAHRVVVADGAMGTMLQQYDLGLDDFEGYEGCNEILSVTRPDVLREIHAAYFAAGSDAVETNTFGANLSALGEYGISDRIAELAYAAAAVARETADAWSTPERPRWVLGSVGPGTKLPTLGHVRFRDLRDAYQVQVAAMLAGGIDGVLIETAQDILQAKAAVIGAKRAIGAAGRDVPVVVSVTVETTGTMLVGSEIGAALVALEPLGIDMISMNCATGPAEMREHLHHLADNARIMVGCMPNAGLPELTADGARYPLQPGQLADALDEYVQDFGLSLVGGCCGTTPEHIRQVVERVGGRELAPRPFRPLPSASSLYTDVPFRQDTSYLAIGERTNANGSKAFREAMLAENWDECVGIARSQSRGGAHLLDLCVDYVGRDGRADMDELAFRFATAVTLPIVLDSTEAAVIEAGLERLGGRSVINSVNYEDGDGPDSRIAKVMPMVKEHGAAVVALTIDEEGQARTAEWKVRVATRLIEDLTERWGLRYGDILVDTLTFPIGTGQQETRRDALETIEAIREIKRRYPEVNTTLGVSNVSFGLAPAARVVLNSVFLHEAVGAGLDSAIVHAAKIMPMNRIPGDQRRVALDMIYDRRTASYDPLSTFLEMFAGVTTADQKAEREAAMAALPVGERLTQRIVDGESKGIEADLDEALRDTAPLDIINTHLLDGMKVVGELFGSGQMQLPFVLQAAETMKTAVAYLEPQMDSDASGAGKGTIVLATVKGDVHDIGKNLVDIILTNNGYDVVNLGIKQPVGAIIEAAEEHHADAIGMSGLLVKSTVVMKDNLLELNTRGLADRYPVLLGGAALTRSYVEQDLQGLFQGEVRYSKDAFEGLALMNAVMDVKRGVPGATLPAPRERRVQAVDRPDRPAVEVPARSDVAYDVDVPTPPFWGTRIVKGTPLREIVEWLDERATLMGRWGLRGTRGGESYEELAEREGRPRIRRLLDRIRTDNLVEPAAVYGYFPVYSAGDEVVLLDPRTPEDLDRTVGRFTFPRQQRPRFLCIADFFRDRALAEAKGPDVMPLQLVTMGSTLSAATATLFAADAYRDYLELHGLGVQLAEAMAEWMHARVRAELGLAAEDATVDAMVRDQAYRGSRYSFGYGACPDLEQRAVIARLLDADRIGVTLSEEFQLHPEESTDAFVVHHPEAKYFNAR